MASSSSGQRRQRKNCLFWLLSVAVHIMSHGERGRKGESVLFECEEAAISITERAGESVYFECKELLFPSRSERERVYSLKARERLFVFLERSNNTGPKAVIWQRLCVRLHCLMVLGRLYVFIYCINPMSKQIIQCTITVHSITINQRHHFGPHFLSLSRIIYDIVLLHTMYFYDSYRLQQKIDSLNLFPQMFGDIKLSNREIQRFWTLTFNHGWQSQSYLEFDREMKDSSRSTKEALSNHIKDSHTAQPVGLVKLSRIIFILLIYILLLSASMTLN